MRPALLCVALAVALLGAVRGAGADQPVTAEASLDREVTAIGDRMTLTLVVTRPEGVLIAPLQSPNLGPDIETIEAMLPEHESLPDGSTRTTFRFMIAAFRTGSLVLPSIPVVYQPAGGAAETAASTPIPFRIRSVIPPGATPTDIRDLKPQVELPGPTASLYSRPVFAVFVTLDVVLALLLLRRRRPTPVTAATPTSARATGSYATQLDEVVRQGFLERADFKAFYRAVARIVRGYLGERYGLPAGALTRRELEHRMLASGLDQWQSRLVNGLLQEADRAVYAEYRPARERAEGDLQLAYQIIELGDTPTAEAAGGGA